MRTTEERIASLHSRAGTIKRRREKRVLTALGSLSVLTVCLLIAIVIHADGLFHGVMSSQFTGSSLLSDGAGGYVLAALTAFFAGVIITAVIYKLRNR